MNATQGENLDLSTITTHDLLAEVARRIEGQTKPESENWPVVNGYEIKPGANLRNADLMGANLRDADLRNADLMDANLRDADLRNADLMDANLRNADLMDARVSDTTIIDLPAGWKIDNGAIAALEGEQ